MTSVLINSDIKHVKAGCVGKLLTPLQATMFAYDNHMHDFTNDWNIIHFPDGQYLSFLDEEFTIIDLKPMSPAFKNYLTKHNLLKRLENE